MTWSLTRRGAVAGLAAFAAFRPAGATGAPLDVLELFTSQGCSSCPAADRLLGAYVGEANVLALSYHINYWDYLGWKDTLAKPAFTDRQYAYSHARGDHRVYTPQMVVNGAEHAVGSDRSAIERARRRTRGSLGERPGLALSAGDGAVTATLGRGRPAEPATLFVVTFAPAVEVAIGRGENAGREVTYHNVVRSLIAAGSWDGTDGAISVARSRLGGDARAVAAFLQTGKPAEPGLILAAAALQLPA